MALPTRWLCGLLALVPLGAIAQDAVNGPVLGSQADRVYLVEFMPPGQCSIQDFSDGGNNCENTSASFGHPGTADPAVCADFTLGENVFTRCVPAKSALPDFDIEATDYSTFGGCNALASAVDISGRNIADVEAPWGCASEWRELSAGFGAGECQSGGLFEDDPACPAQLTRYLPVTDKMCYASPNYVRWYPDGAIGQWNGHNVWFTFYPPAGANYYTNLTTSDLSLTNIGSCPGSRRGYWVRTFSEAGVSFAAASLEALAVDPFAVASLPDLLGETNHFRAQLDTALSVAAPNISFDSPTSYAGQTYTTGTWSFGSDPDVPADWQADAYTDGWVMLTGADYATVSAGTATIGGQPVAGSTPSTGGDTGGGDSGGDTGGDTGGTTGGDTGGDTGGASDYNVAAEAAPDIGSSEITIDGFDFGTRWLPDQCPAPVVLAMGPFGDQSLELTLLCDYSGIISSFVVMSALFAALFIVLGNRSV